MADEKFQFVMSSNISMKGMGKATLEIKAESIDGLARALGDAAGDIRRRGHLCGPFKVTWNKKIKIRNRLNRRFRKEQIVYAIKRGYK